MTYELKEDLMNNLREAGSIKYYPGMITLKNGDKSHFYFDVRGAVCNSYDTKRQIIGMLGNEIKQEDKIDSIATGGYGGMPIASSLQDIYPTKITLVRDKPKPYGEKKMIDGYSPKKGDSVIIVDDVFTGGTSVSHMKDVIEKTGADIAGCYVVIDRSGEKSKYEKVKNSLGFPVKSLLKFDDLEKYLLPSK